MLQTCAPYTPGNQSSSLPDDQSIRHPCIVAGCGDFYMVSIFRDNEARTAAENNRRPLARLPCQGPVLAEGSRAEKGDPKFDENRNTTTRSDTTRHNTSLPPRPSNAKPDHVPSSARTGGIRNVLGLINSGRIAPTDIDCSPNNTTQQVAARRQHGRVSVPNWHCQRTYMAALSSIYSILTLSSSCLTSGMHFLRHHMSP
jgi:hypothetical protein